VQPFLLWKSSKYCTSSVCICSLRYPASNVHAPYCHLWPVRLHNILPHYLINGTDFEKKKKTLLNVKYEFRVLLKLLSEIFLILSEIWSKLYIGLHVKSDLKKKKLKFFSTGFWKIHKYQLTWKSVWWEPSYSMRTDRQTDRHDEANSRFSQFGERA
jgi:hypothetical protein